MQLETVDNVRFVTDSNGLVAIDDPALMNQKIGKYSYEVIFVSNGSTDSTEQLLKDAEQTYGSVGLLTSGGLRSVP